jgi:uncharacterized protein YndB with AHSA1/START domain
MRIELQAEVPGPREALFPLVATLDGLRRWLDGAELERGTGTADEPDGAAQLEIGSRLRLRFHEGIAHARVVALDPPQHVSLSWSWEGEPPTGGGVVAVDLIAHGERTHMTLRHVGLVTSAAVALHEGIWRHWFGRLERAARSVGRAAARVPERRAAAPDPPGR